MLKIKKIDQLKRSLIDVHSTETGRNHHYPNGVFCTYNSRMGHILIKNLSPKWSIRAKMNN